MEVGFKSDKGLKRSNNEDAVSYTHLDVYKRQLQGESGHIQTSYFK